MGEESKQQQQPNLDEVRETQAVKELAKAISEWRKVGKPRKR